MDITQQQAKVDTLTATVATDQATLSADRAALTEAETELAQVTLINQLEALNSDQVAAINAALAGDAANINGISLNFPSATVTETSQESQA